VNVLLAAYLSPNPPPHFDATYPFLVGLFVLLAILVWMRRKPTSA
jgi:hypothetical protein